MLKRFRVNNFRSLLNVEFRPVELNVLIGPNNSGKTNLCSALRFLGLTASQPLEDAIRASVGETWNIQNVYASEQNIEMEAECSLPYEGERVDLDYFLALAARGKSTTHAQVLRVCKETLRVTGAGFTQASLLENFGDEVTVAQGGWSQMLGVSGRGSALDYTKTPSPTDTTSLCQLYPSVHRLTKLFREYLQNWAYYSLSPASLRAPEVVQEAAGLRYDGGNLTRTFFLLHNEVPYVEAKLIEIIRALEPRLNLFTYSSPDPEHVHLYMEDQKRNRFSTQSISDGTLRFMAMAYLLLSGEDSKMDSLPHLTIIEEPENGLYVGHLKPLFERLRTRGRPEQIIFTTHSPYFIDLFDSCLEGVHVVKPGVPSSEIKKVDVEKTRKLLEEMPLGEMHFREMLG
jgi:predicted ATPase